MSPLTNRETSRIERKWLAKLRERGLRLTPQRLALVRELAADTSHPTAQELFERLRASLPTMSFATVYNTLDALVAEGLCVPRTLAPGATRFDPNATPHHHAVCDGCGCVTDLESAAPVDHARADHARADAPGVPSGFEVRVVERIFRGLCASCRAAASSDASPRATESTPARRQTPARHNQIQPETHPRRERCRS
ncbi:MAG: Fur family transcriptional regulator [Polyangiaceae bacterium]